LPVKRSNKGQQMARLSSPSRYKTATP